MRYQINCIWPVCGGSCLVGPNTVIDAATYMNGALVGVIPPPMPYTTPLDTECSEVLRRAYPPGGPDIRALAGG
jgi:hypothetical protein